MPTPTPLPTPSYSPTDIGAALTVVIGFGLDVLVGFFPQLQLDAATRVTLISSLTLLTGAAITAFITNRRVKVQAQAQVAIAQVASGGGGAVPDPNAAFTGGLFVITPYALPTAATEVKA